MQKTFKVRDRVRSKARQTLIGTVAYVSTRKDQEDFPILVRFDDGVEGTPGLTWQASFGVEKDTDDYDAVQAGVITVGSRYDWYHKDALELLEAPTTSAPKRRRTTFRVKDKKDGESVEVVKTVEAAIKDGSLKEGVVFRFAAGAKCPDWNFPQDVDFTLGEFKGMTNGKPREMFLWHTKNDHQGSRGEKEPPTGKYSWCVRYENEDFKASKVRLNIPKPAPKKPVSIEDLARLIVPDEVKQEIVSVALQHERRDVLMNDWGLADVIEYGRGMVFLFWGPPGTGKTYTAKLLGQAMKLDVQIVSNAELQSAIPGQFERNLQELFATATTANKVLLFDECDSMLQSRVGMGQVMSSENNALLTAIEKHEGIVFLTTNRIDCLDEALERRVSLIIEFKLPGFNERKAIFERHLPKKLPLAGDVNRDELAEHCLSGGQIKNVVLNAARFAVGRGADKVEASDFNRAIERVQAGSTAFEKREVETYSVGGREITRQVRHLVKAEA